MSADESPRFETLGEWLVAIHPSSMMTGEDIARAIEQEAEYQREQSFLLGNHSGGFLIQRRSVRKLVKLIGKGSYREVFQKRGRIKREYVPPLFRG